jgi:2-polyprenyl-6-methoxyphenol hydroxylase-like FAD-dependent oxidoreductase
MPAGKTLRITCVGAGPGGLYFAISAKLRRPQDEITVRERQPEHASLGWGVTFVPSLLEELYANDPVSAQAIEKATFRWRDQFVDIRGERVIYDGGVDVYNLNRPELVEILTARARELGVRVEYDSEVTDPAALPEADLVVAADGVGSRLRQSAGGFGTQVVTGDDKYIWLGTDRPCRAFAYHFKDTPHGWIWASSYGTESELSTFVVHCTAVTWQGLGYDTMTTEESLAALSELFGPELEGHRLIGQFRDGSSARWQSFRTVTNERWHHGKTVLLGDSAHTTHFSSGEGTTLALEDAIALADSLADHDDLDAALAAYQALRGPLIAQSQHRARLSAGFFAQISRYTSLNADQFATLVHARRSPLVPLIPPWLYYQLRHATREAPVLRQLRSAAKAIRNQIRGNRGAIRKACDAS